jgi:hypothetical protein
MVLSMQWFEVRIANVRIQSWVFERELNRLPILSVLVSGQKLKRIEDSLQQAAVPPLAGFPVGNFNRSIIRSHSPQQAAGNALAITV